MPKADVIFHNAHVITMNADCPYGRGVAIRNGKITAVLRNDEFRELVDVRTELIDCRGLTLIPGFIDAHCHPVAFAEGFINPDISPSSVKSLSDIQNTIRSVSRNTLPGAWIRAGRYNEFYLDEKRHPTRWDLDEATNTYPVKISHRTGHAHVLNSMALDMVGISTITPDPPGGLIEREVATGEPNGILYGMGEYLSGIIPPLSEQEFDQGIGLANETLLSLGVTSVQDASHHNGVERWNMFQRWKDRGYLKPRVNMMLSRDAFRQYRKDDFVEMDCQLRSGAVKILVDETRGDLNPSQADLDEMVATIHRSDFQVAIHALEETAIQAACAALKDVLSKASKQDHRHRIEHCSVCTPEMARSLAELGLAVVTQPAFIFYSGDRYLDTVPGADIDHLYPIRTLVDAGVHVAAGSDCPVVPPNPLHGIYAAVSRKTTTGQTVAANETISALQALQLYTRNAACACFEEDVKGTIDVGKLADLVLLDDDLIQVAPDKLQHVNVLMTVIGGEVVHDTFTQ